MLSTVATGASPPSPYRASVPRGEGGGLETVSMDMSEDECATVAEVMGTFTVGLSKRQGIMGRSQAVGWTDFRRHIGVSQETMKPHMVHLQLRVNAIIKHYYPQFAWRTLM